MKKTFKMLASALVSLIAGAALTNDAMAQTYCQPNTANFVNTYEWITNVSLGGLNQTSGAGATSYSNFTSISPAQLTIGTAATLSVTISPSTGINEPESIYGYIDWNQNGTFETGEYINIIASTTSAGPHTVQVTPPASALTGTTRMRIILDFDGMNDTDPCLNTSGGIGGGGEVEDYTVNVQSANTTPVTSVAVATQGGAAATITTNAGTLQMTATVLPAAATQTVTWSIVPGTGTATISATGLVTAQTNGTVWAKAVSTVNPSKKDSLQLTLSNQVSINSVTVATQGGVPATITTNAGTLQMTATVLPATATQTVTWSIVPGTGTATISATGLVTAQTNGTVWAKAVSTANTSKKDSLQLTLSNQAIAVNSVTVATQGGASAMITTNAGTLQMTATVLPVAAPQTVTWSIVPGTGTATISATGLVTAQTNGTVWAKAVSTVNPSKKDSLQLTISNQAIAVNSVTVATQGGAPATITTNAGTLQMTATVLPAAAPQTVTWSIVPGTGTATISATGLVTAQTNGTVWAKAVSTANTSKKDSLQLTISNQAITVNSVTVATQGGVPAAISTNAGTLQMTATVLPAAAPQTVTWSIVPGTGTATISATGLVTAQTNGTVWAKAVSTANTSKKDSLQITITKQGTGIDDLFTSGAVDVYPNPASNQLNIDFVQWSAGTFSVSIVNLSGQEVYKATLDRKKSAHDIANLASGTYILSIQDAKGNRSGIKINKQ